MLTIYDVQPAIGSDGKKKEPESNVLLATIENMQYVVTVDVLHTVGTYVTTAATAKEALDGHCIYDGGYCKLHLTYTHHTDLNVEV
ncbi:Polypyrimidine tract-binding protein [Sesbania bispinosa]|nr:Polypyrimidine tract-binding protein [Sesbania bispinosa]